jgi:hypothetical protein
VRAAARLVAVVGAVSVGYFLFRAHPHEVTLVYDLAAAPDATALEVVIRRQGELVRRAEFGAPPRQVRHRVRLPEGTYQLSFRVATSRGPLRLERSVDVTEEGTIVLPLAP